MFQQAFARSMSVAILVLTTSAGLAQNLSSKHVNVPVIPARPADVSSPDAIVKATFDSESGQVGVPRQWARERALYDKDAIIVAAGPGDHSKNSEPHRFTFQRYVDENDDYFVKNGTADRPLGCVVNRRAYIASVTCGYEYSEMGKVQERGVDMFQLYNDGTRWWIVAVVWDKESKDNPIGPELLGK